MSATNEKLKTVEEEATSPATEGLTGRPRAQFAGAIRRQVDGIIGLGVGGLWAEKWGALCEDTHFLIESHQKIL